MRQIFFFLCLWPLLLRAHWDVDEEDLSSCHHVNIISGHLNLLCQDRVVNGAKPLPIYRSYTSEGALWTDSSYRLAGGGWNWFPHLNMSVYIADNQQFSSIDVSEPSGQSTRYTVKSIDYRKILFTSQGERKQVSGVLSGRKNSENQQIEYVLKDKTAILRASDGGERHYGPAGQSLSTQNAGQYRLLLLQEKLPSGHYIHYRYNYREIDKIELRNPQGSKCFASVEFKYLHRGEHTNVSPFQYQLITSDGTLLDYRSMTFKNINYLNAVSGEHRPKEFLEYRKARKGQGARLREFSLGNELQFVAHYHEPANRKEEKKWHSRGYSSHQGDKVRLLEAKVGADGTLYPLAQFSYVPKQTDVRDTDRILTRYHHDDKRIQKVEYFDEKERLHSSLQLRWQRGWLMSKALLDAEQRPLFSRTFTYDDAGNVLEEIFWGNLTGAAQGPFSIDASGQISGAESYRKRYQYLPRFNVPVFEEEEGGLTYRYEYLPGTDLVIAKWTCDGHKIVMREFFLYDEDHLLIAEIVDDGSTGVQEDTARVTERKIRRYIRHPTLGLVVMSADFYWDPERGQEILLKHSVYRYSEQHQVVKEDVQDAQGTYRYTLHTDYDAWGNVIRKTTPCGQENTYRYSPNGYLLESKEVGSPRKIYTCTPLGKPIVCNEIDEQGRMKTTRSHYDAKGRLLAQTDAFGNTTHQTYDAFGHCLSTQFPELPGNATPCVRYTYDVAGNIASVTTPEGAMVRTTYNAFRKPIHIVQADGTEIFHTYTLQGLLKETVHPDKTRTTFTYDLFQRMTSRTTCSVDGAMLAQETWKYDAFHLLEYTDPRGLTTHYAYDPAGRKIREVAEGRSKTFTYDALGFLETTTAGGITHVQQRDVEGHVVHEWIEEGLGHRENEMQFFYDKNFKKIKALRQTSQGLATDLFAYDGEARLIQHTDPLGAITCWEYTLVFNELHQQVLQKTTIDPLNQRTVEIYDAMGHLAQIEKQDADGQTVGLDRFQFDASGHRIQRLSTVYQGAMPTKTLETRWSYDSMGRMIEQIEPQGRTTRFTYDVCGRLAQKTLPSQMILTYGYDGLDRVTELYSSDGTIHYRYAYRQGPDPTQIVDYIHQFRIQRDYNAFGELLCERGPQGFEYLWEYDKEGRCTQFLLPDRSSISYGYTGAHLTSVNRYSSEGTLLYTHHYTQFDPNGHIAEEILIDGSSYQVTQRDLLERPVGQSSKHLLLTTAYGPSGLVTDTQSSFFGAKGYRYDPLNQLIQEGSRSYAFDSFGNPTDCLVDDHHQILRTQEVSLSYDPDGNPIRRGDIEYTYDALGRLISIQFPDRKVEYAYDPLSRLLFKETQDLNGQRNRIAYLYNQAHEIGTATLEGQILQLKVLGLGIRGDIGAAVAIELDGTPLAPQHDFNGNVIALLSMQGLLTDFCDIDAFGTASATPSSNPWRFCSKRSEEGLVFFGERFYDPTLKRWLTPDPAGPIDGPNLYLYVLNSPMNRLDLFGLRAASRFPWSDHDDEGVSIEISEPQIESLRQGNTVECKGSIGGVEVDWVVSCRHSHKLQFSAEELETGKVNLVDHFSELVPKEGAVVGLVTWQNGMNVRKRDFKRMSDKVVDHIPEGTLGIGLYNPTQGFIRDVFRVVKEFCGIETPTVHRTRQMMNAFIEVLPEINPQVMWFHGCHSEGGLIAKNSIKKITEERREKLKNHLICVTLGSAAPLSNEHTKYAINYYSDKDRVTKRFGESHMNDSNYEINITHCLISKEKRNVFTGDHDFIEATYQHALNLGVDYVRGLYGFYDGR